MSLSGLQAVLMSVRRMEPYAIIGGGAARDLWMDYVKNAGVRLILMLATIFWLIACAAWTVQILWSV